MHLIRRPNTRRIAIGVIVGASLAVTGILPIAAGANVSVKTAVARWSPNQAKYCSATLGFSELWNGGIHKSVTARWELLYLENTAVYAPTRLLHSEIGPMAVAFSNLIGDASGMRAFTRHPEWAPPSFATNDAKVRAFLKSLAPYDTVHGDALTKSISACARFPSGLSVHAEQALTSATTAYYVNVANGGTQRMTIAQYQSALPAGVGDYVHANGSNAKFSFTKGAAVCVTRPAPNDPPPSVVACRSTST
jgi:hypothetical protein